MTMRNRKLLQRTFTNRFHSFKHQCTLVSCSPSISLLLYRQNPMLQNMIRNDPNISPMVRQQMETMANNPAMLQQMMQRMQDPAVRAQFQRAMQSGGGMGMPSGAGMPSMGMPPTASNNNNTSNPTVAPNPPPRDDQGQTEEEMIAEAIRRSLEDN